ncbi:tripartite tricarboxylate transporter substrate binding protein [Comamonas sp. 17RB]|uniref:Bug family tripartite tricarboxylate transporter substrate binding protein n=1 Tax=Comamonas sp. 17RB TaxID=3047025 RepID=UPI0024B7F2F5|nr:tripartite tricarboxylate transporter substrate binding protein [Comamonas sp. 17RB]MDI9854888.1 tripartite tricarboxylate transporter substrate binding protein [Comamonas sp. 17RB]
MLPTTLSLSRRHWLRHSLAGLAASGSPWWLANAQTSPGAAPLPQNFLQPHKAVTIVVGGPAGGATDGVARVVAQGLSQTLQREVIVENKPGAGGTIGSKYVSQARNDGHTLLLGHIGTNVLSPLMQTPRPYDPVQGFTPIGQIGNTASVLVVPANGPATLEQALAQWKRKGQLSYASTGLGSGPHFLGHLLAQALGAQGLHVPYRGSPFALQDLVGGRVDCMLATAGAIGAYLDSKKLRALAIASQARSRFYPQLPTLREAGLASVANEGWFGLFASAQTPLPVAQALHAHLNAALQAPQAAAPLEGLVVEVATSASPSDYARFIQGEATHWSQVVTQLGAALKAT